MKQKECGRCGGSTPTYDFDLDRTSGYGFQLKTETETYVRKYIRLIVWAIYGRAAKGGSHVLQSDNEEVPLCDDCGGLLIGRFMQGRDVPALAGKEGW